MYVNILGANIDTHADIHSHTHTHRHFGKATSKYQMHAWFIEAITMDKALFFFKIKFI